MYVVWWEPLAEINIRCIRRHMRHIYIRRDWHRAANHLKILSRNDESKRCACHITPMLTTRHLFRATCDMEKCKMEKMEEKKMENCAIYVLYILLAKAKALTVCSFVTFFHSFEIPEVRLPLSSASVKASRASSTVYTLHQFFSFHFCFSI